MKVFSGDVVLKDVKGKRFAYLVVEPVSYENDFFKIDVKGGWETDGASVPKFLQNIFAPFADLTIEAAIVHDALYMAEALPRKKCDEIFLEIMELSGVPYWKRKLMYIAVRIGGGAVWKEHNKKAVNEAKKYVQILK
jgi:hypothetical protein